MKTILVSVTLFFFVSSALACTDNPSFDLCKQTATIASSQCDIDKVPAKCHCSAEKQLLACYSECAGDPAVLGLQNEQRRNMVTVCTQPGAEAEVKMQKKNSVKNTVGVPVHVNEPFTVKPKPQSVSLVDDGGSVMDSSAQEHPTQSTGENQPTTNNNNEKTDESTNSNNNNDEAHDNTFSDSFETSSNGVAHLAAQTPLLVVLCTIMYFFS